MKIATLRAREAFVREKHGVAALDALRQSASPELRKTLLEHDPKRGWVDFDLFIETNVLADQMFGQGDLELCVDMGRFAATFNMGLWKTFAMKNVPPELIISLGAGLWGQHYDRGRFVSRPTGPSSLIASIVDFPKPHRAQCLSVKGWGLGTAEAGPRKNVVVDELSCRALGDDRCDFEVSWEPA